MKLHTILFYSFILLSCSYYIVSSDKDDNLNLTSDMELKLQWTTFKKDHHQRYYSFEQEIYRFEVFKHSLMIIEKNNQNPETTVILGVNKFADLTLLEFSETYLNGVHQKDIVNRRGEDVSQETSILEPGSINWVEKGAVSPVPNQGQCGSSWAFGAVGAITSAHAIKNNFNVVNLSVEQVNDCTPGSYGCNGGWITGAYDYAQTQPLTTQAIYPYVSGNGNYHACNTTLAETGKYGVNSYVEDNGSCSNLQKGIFYGPVATASDSSNSSWQLYQSGILTNCGNNPNHGILVVGYTPQYWLLQNWWGTSWGMGGYIQLGPGNTCGICNYAAYPIV